MTTKREHSVMAKRENHYEKAFEAWLRAREIPYVAVDEKRRSLWGGGSIKNLDFIVSPGRGLNWLVDVKGRQFGAEGAAAKGAYWKSWSTQDDVRGLTAWESLLGPGFGGLLAFVYNVQGPKSPLPEDQLFVFESRRYAMIGVTLAEYTSAARVVSPKWQTVAVPTTRFKELAAELDALFKLEQVLVD